MNPQSSFKPVSLVKSLKFFCQPQMNHAVDLEKCRT